MVKCTKCSLGPDHLGLEMQCHHRLIHSLTAGIH